MRRLALSIFVALAAGVALAASHDVPLEVTEKDKRALGTLGRSGDFLGRPMTTLQDEIDVVLAVQDSVLAAAPIDKEIPHGRTRELSDVLQAHHGLCYDRSRAIETALRALGFETRHAAIYSTAETGSALASLATPGVESHAVTEVKTLSGWMLVDSNQRWIGLSDDGRPVDLAGLRESPDQVWHKLSEDPLPDIFDKPFTWAYGLYSRHGKFYPPFNPIPDINWSEMIQNL